MNKHTYCERLICKCNNKFQIYINDTSNEQIMIKETKFIAWTDIFEHLSINTVKKTWAPLIVYARTADF